MTKKSIRDLQLNGKKVLMRVDFNVPMKGGVITDETVLYKHYLLLNMQLNKEEK